jgi:hypothetical protein
VDEETFRRVADAVRHMGAERLKPIFDHLGGGVPFDSIRLSLACLRNRGVHETGFVVQDRGPTTPGS